MTNIRLLPVVILAVAALLVLKTVGLVTHGGYVLAGMSQAQAAGGEGDGEAAPGEITLPGDETIEDIDPTLADDAPTLGAPEAEAADAAGAHGPTEAGEGEANDAAMPDEPANAVAAENACDPLPVSGAEAAEGDAADGEGGNLQVIPADCPPLADAVPQMLTPDGPQPLNAGDSTLTEQALLQRLSERRKELETYAQDLDMRASLVDAAEKRLEERTRTLQEIEGQISALVEQRKQMEEGQFAGIVAMYETMKPRDAAAIFDTLDIEVLLRVAKMMSPRKMAPILAEMDTQRAQELTVRMAALSDTPVDQMAPDDLAALPQIIGQ